MTEPPRSPYEVLGIAPDATPAQIRAAYRRRALELHPDRFPSDDEAHIRAGALMRDLNDAWRQLQPSMKPGAVAGTATERPPARPPGWQPFPPAGRWGNGCAWLAAAGAAALIASVIAVDRRALLGAVGHRHGADVEHARPRRGVNRVPRSAQPLRGQSGPGVLVGGSQSHPGPV